MLLCNKDDSPMGILSSDKSTIWHLENLEMFPVGEYSTVKIIEITQEEYDILKTALDENKIIEEPEPQPEEPQNPSEEDIIDNNTLEMVRSAKIQEMSRLCNQTIINGFDIVLSDNISYHFSLEITDQIMISKLNDKANNGETLLPWHSDGNACKFYSQEDIKAINTAMESLITYHQTYFNSLKLYIMALNTLLEISEVFYGIDIPIEYQSEVLIALLEQMKG